MKEYGLKSFEYGQIQYRKLNLKSLELKKQWTKRNADNIGYLVQEYIKQNYQYITIFTDRSKDSRNDCVGVCMPEFGVTM